MSYGAIYDSESHISGTWEWAERGQRTKEMKKRGDGKARLVSL